MIETNFEDFFNEKRLYSRGASSLLNMAGHHSVAAISFSLELYEGRTWVDATVTISDCNRVINLDLSFETEESYKNSLHKLDTLIAVLTEANSTLVEIKPVYDDAVLKEKKKKEEEAKKKKGLDK